MVLEKLRYVVLVNFLTDVHLTSRLHDYLELLCRFQMQPGGPIQSSQLADREKFSGLTHHQLNRAELGLQRISTALSITRVQRCEKVQAYQLTEKGR